ncbi:MAG: glycosyltransferase [Actinomycetaceae bacterium]|nr:glycosyltransferase [Actinomycetaceae bacterium]
MAEPTVTALVVTTGQTPFLSRTLSGLRAQSRLPNRVVIVNVSKRPLDVDDFETVLMPAARNFGDAIRQAIKLDPTILESDWLWTLHDDSAPYRKCLDELIQTGEAGVTIGLVGPKQLAWSNPDRLLEVGIRASRAGRRMDYLLPGEIDQGQHDNVSDVLAVGTAGMLIRSEIWRETKGPDPALGPFGDGLELSRRVHLMGYRTAVAPRARIAHARASYRDVRDEDEPDIARSFDRRRGAQLYNAMLAQSSVLFVLMLLTLPFLTLGRILVRLLTKRLDLALAELSGMGRAYLHLPDAIRGRARIRAGQKVPGSVLFGLEESNYRITKAKRTMSRREREPKPVDTIEPVAARLLRAHRMRSAVAGVIGIGLTIVMTVFATRSLSVGITGAAWVNLPDEFSALWHEAWSGWVVGGAGAPGPADPLLMVWALVSAPFALVGISPRTILTAFWVIAPVLAWAFMYRAAVTLTHRVPWRFTLATVWVALPAFLTAWSQGRLAGVIVHVALPLLLLGFMRTVHHARPLRIRGAQYAEVKVEDRTLTASYAALAAAMSVVVVAAVPWTGLALILMGVVLIASRPKVWKTSLAVILPALVMMLPTWIAALQLPGTRKLRFLLAESGSTMQFPVAPTWQTMLGLPQDLTAYPALGNEWLQLAWLIPGALIALGATIALFNFSATWLRTRLVYMIAVAAFVIAIVAARTAVAFEGVLVGAWPGPALSIAAICLMVAWAGLLSPLILEEEARSYRARKRLAALERRRRKRAKDAEAQDGDKPEKLVKTSERILRPITAIGLAASFVLPIVTLAMWIPHSNSVNYQATTGQAVQDVIGPAPLYQTPAAVLEAQEYPRHARFLVLNVTEDGVHASLLRGNGRQLADSASRPRLESAVDIQYAQVEGRVDALVATDKASIAFAELVGQLLTSPEQSKGLTNFAVDQVALTFGSGAAHAAAQTALDQNPSLERAGETEIGALWRARPAGVEPARAYIDDQGTITPIPSGLIGGSLNLDEYEFSPEAVLVLSERADENWRATIEATALEPADYGWQQAFHLDQSTGTVKIAHHNDWMPLWWVTSAVSVIGIAIAALPIRRRIRTHDA